MGKFTEIGFTCTQPCGSECVCLESVLGGKGQQGEEGAEARASCPVCSWASGFLEGYVSHLACPFFAPTSHLTSAPSSTNSPLCPPPHFPSLQAFRELRFLL